MIVSFQSVAVNKTCCIAFQYVFNPKVKVNEKLYNFMCVAARQPCEIYDLYQTRVPSSYHLIENYSKIPK